MASNSEMTRLGKLKRRLTEDILDGGSLRLLQHLMLNHTQGQTLPKLSPHDYNVGWVCALPIEMAAAEAMLDVVHATLHKRPDDPNTYTLGSIGMHNIVIACLPSGFYGTNSAIGVAIHMSRSFPSIRMRLMVGIGGGAPGKVDIRLGDVVVSNSVIQHDMGKTVQEGFQCTGDRFLPPSDLMVAISALQANHQRLPGHIPDILSQMLERYPSMTRYAHPGPFQDLLFESSYDHPPSARDCDRCDASKLVQRSQRADARPLVHYGGIASGNQVIKDGKTRDRLANDLDIICFEMEAAGLMQYFPCLIIRGICDYSDSHKHKQWQQYAAAVAAAYAKELLLNIC